MQVYTSHIQCTYSYHYNIHVHVGVVEGTVWQVIRSGDHGTLAYFWSRPNRIAVTKDPKKDVNACVGFINTVVKGHFVVCVCQVLGISSLDEPPVLPSGIHTASECEQLALINRVARLVFDHCTLIDGAFTNETVVDNGNGVYNYVRVLFHYGSLVMELIDAWREGDGERVLWCWKLFLPHLKVSGCTKFSLEALKLQFQTSLICVLSQSCSIIKSYGIGLSM